MLSATYCGLQPALRGHPQAGSRRGGGAHARRKSFDLARLNQAPIAIEAVERIDALFAIEREISGAASPERVGVRNMRSRPLVGALETWLRERRAKLSGKSETAKAID
jgi:transposase